MARYEYKRVHFSRMPGTHDELEKRFNEYGAQGFKFVCLDATGLSAIFERQILTPGENESAMIGLMALREIIDARMVELDAIAEKKKTE